MEANSTTEAAVTLKSKRRIRTLLFRGVLALIAAAFVAAIATHLSWKYSGSNEWKQVGEFIVEGDAPTAIPTATPSLTPTPSLTLTPSRTATSTLTPTLTKTSTPTKTPSASATP